MEVPPDCVRAVAFAIYIAAANRSLKFGSGIPEKGPQKLSNDFNWTANLGPHLLRMKIGGLRL